MKKPVPPNPDRIAQWILADGGDEEDFRKALAAEKERYAKETEMYEMQTSGEHDNGQDC